MASHKRKKAIAFSHGHIPHVSVLALLAIVIPALQYPLPIARSLDWLNGVTIALFGFWFVWVLAIATLLCIVLAAWPPIGKLKLGGNNEKPEFSFLSWITMLYGAGVSAALLKWSVAEPMHYLQTNPELIKGLATEGSHLNFRMAMKWAFLHWGISAWACYAITGLAIAFVCYRQNRPVSIGYALAPLLGRSTSHSLSRVINVLIILVGMLCLLQILSFGVEQVSANLQWIGFVSYSGPIDSSTLLLLAIVTIICAASIGFAHSGLQHGMKQISSVNIALSALLLGCLLAATSFKGIQILIICLIDYIVALPNMAVGMWYGDSQPGSLLSQLEHWQRHWSLFHWTWWIPFTGFIGLFMARISKGRTVREFVTGAMVVPSFLCISWLAWAGGTAMQMESVGVQGIELASVANANKLLAMIEQLFSPTSSRLLSSIVIIMIATYLITTISSALLVFSSISGNTSEVDEHSHQRHSRLMIIFWGVLLTMTSLAVNHFGASAAIQSAMCLFALPTTILIVCLCGSLVKATFSASQQASTVLVIDVNP